MTLAQDIAAFAVSSVQNVKQTVYQHHSEIDPSLGIYKCDCNGFVGFVLPAVVPDQYAKIQAQEEQGQPRPRAFVYYDFFSGLAPGASDGWQRINLLQHAIPGDILAWRFKTVEPHEDTGHVVVVRERATLENTGVYSLRVCDSSPVPHFDDTRASGSSGVGSGYLKFKIDGEGRPIAFLFTPPTTGTFQYSYVPIAIGRVEGV